MVEMVETIQNILPLLIPLILIDLAFKIYSIVDIVNEDRKVKGGNKIIWLIVIVLVSYGWVIYLIFGKDE